MISSTTKTTVLFLISICILPISCQKEEDQEDQICFYQNYEPDLVVEEFLSFGIDVDYDGNNDLSFTPSPEIGVYEIKVEALSDGTQLSTGMPVKSGSGASIYKGQEINADMDWKSSMVFTQTGFSVEYLGIQKKVGTTSYYGWIEVNKTESNFELKEVYFYNSDRTPVYAGAQNDECKPY